MRRRWNEVLSALAALMVGGSDNPSVQAVPPTRVISADQELDAKRWKEMPYEEENHSSPSVHGPFCSPLAVAEVLDVAKGAAATESG